MASWKTERTFAGKNAAEIYQATKKVIEDLAGKYSLKHQADDQKLSGTVKQIGVNGSYQASSEKVAITLEYGMLIPGSIRDKVQAEVTRQLDKLFG